jgi:hypothetical protein
VGQWACRTKQEHPAIQLAATFEDAIERRTYMNDTRRRTTIYAALVILSVPRPALCGDAPEQENQLWNTANQCSEAALRRYALSSTEPAEKVAEAALDKCKGSWLRPAQTVGRRIEAETRETQKDCIKFHGASSPMCNRLPPSMFFLDLTRERFVHDASKSYPRRRHFCAQRRPWPARWRQARYCGRGGVKVGLRGDRREVPFNNKSMPSFPFDLAHYLQAVRVRI